MVHIAYQLYFNEAVFLKIQGNTNEVYLGTIAGLSSLTDGAGEPWLCVGIINLSITGLPKELLGHKVTVSHLL